MDCTRSKYGCCIDGDPTSPDADGYNKKGCGGIPAKRSVVLTYNTTIIIVRKIPVGLVNRRCGA